MSTLVLVDSSAWIKVVRRENSTSEALKSKVNRLLAQGDAALAHPVWLELYQGIKGKREEHDLHTLRGLCGWLEFDDACWKLAAEEGRLCLRNGISVPMGDLLVHACARRHGVSLLHCDRHFELIDKICPT